MLGWLVVSRGLRLDWIAILYYIRFEGFVNTEEWKDGRVEEREDWKRGRREEWKNGRAGKGEEWKSGRREEWEEVESAGLETPIYRGGVA